jgi:hypothetical protein
MYTDLKAEIEDLQGGFCPGMEAAFGQLNQAFKRLTTPNQLSADGSVPPSTTVPLPWWDMMRYMWRGTAAVRLRNLAVVLANSGQPHVGAQDPRIVLHASTFSVAMVAGRIDITSTDMSTVAFARGPDAGPGGRGVNTTEAFPGQATGVFPTHVMYSSWCGMNSWLTLCMCPWSQQACCCP